MKSPFSDHAKQGSNWESFQPVLQHFIKNKLQGINGGSYLVDYGLKHQCLKTIENGWGIVHRNQDDIVRCTTAMMLINRRIEAHLERVYFAEIVKEALEELDRRYPSNSLRSERNLVFQHVLCDADATSLQTCLLNLFRLLDSLEPRAGGGLEIKISVIDDVLFCQLRSARDEIGINEFGQIHGENLTPDQQNLLTAEWLALKKVVADHFGKITFSQIDNMADFTFEMPVFPTRETFSSMG